MAAEGAFLEASVAELGPKSQSKGVEREDKMPGTKHR